MRLILGIYFFIFASAELTSLQAQQVRFYHNLTIDQAMSMAKDQGKGIFVDTYADWCVPCKKMEIEFRNRDLADFMNEHYINVRIDMDRSPHADQYRNKFSIVFLPTMVVLDYLGNVKFKTDKIIPGQELLRIAEGSLEQGVYFQNEAAAVQSNPFNNQQVSKEEQINKAAPKPNQTAKTTKPPSKIATSTAKSNTSSTEGRVIYSVGSQGINPDYLRREAYFRIELMDGSHRATADKYLATQDDLTTDNNVKFVYDFLYSVHSPTFKFMAENRDLFDKQIGKENIQHSISFMVQNELDNGFPRPTFAEAEALLMLVDSTNYKTLTYQYYLDRLLEVCDFEEYKTLGLQYLQETKINDHIVFFNIAELCYHHQSSKPELQQCHEWLKNAVKVDEDNIFYQDLLAQILIKLKSKKKAKKVAKKLITLATKYNHDLNYYQNLQKEIKSL